MSLNGVFTGPGNPYNLLQNSTVTATVTATVKATVRVASHPKGNLFWKGQPQIIGDNEAESLSLPKKMLQSKEESWSLDGTLTANNVDHKTLAKQFETK